MPRRPRAGGVELAVESELARDWNARAALTWMTAEYDEGFETRSRGNVPHQIPAGNRIPGIPALTAYAELAWKPLAGLELAGEALYRGKVRQRADDKPRAPAYTCSTCA